MRPPLPSARRHAEFRELNEPAGLLTKSSPRDRDIERRQMPSFLCAVVVFAYK